MTKQFAYGRQPDGASVQNLIGLYNTGRLDQAEALARQLLARHPDDLTLLSIFGSALAAQGKLDEAAASFKKAAARHPRSAEMHSNLGLVLQQQGKYADALASFRKALALRSDLPELHYNMGIVLAELGRTEEASASYRRSISLNPRLAPAHFNLGTVLQAAGKLEEAAECYRRALALEPGWVEAHGNLGTVLQQQGRLDEAIASYQRGLSIQPDAKTCYNLGTALRDQGNLDEAIASYRAALSLNPAYAEAHNNLGEALRDYGKADEAFASFERALAIDPRNPQANYNLGLFYQDAGKLEAAIPYYEASRLYDWQDRVLYCLYKSGRYDDFEQRLRPLLTERHASPMIATLSGHYATNFGCEDPYNFCKNPLDFVHLAHIDELTDPNSSLLSDLLRDITHAEIDERKQGRLYHGIQSSGNLFKRPEASFARLAELIKEEVRKYRRRFEGADCVFMQAFPREPEIASSWYIKMHQGGHLTSHIHEEGWLSGSCYLALPADKGDSGNAGSIEFSTHGDDYPRRHDNFPLKVISPRVGDLVMFPSSLFHRTIPFSSDEERICVAFDVKPAVS